MGHSIAPYGTELKNRIVSGEAAIAIADTAYSLPKLRWSARQRRNLDAPIHVLYLPQNDEFPESYLTPRRTREYFADKNGSATVGFQTRNPVHRAHEYLQKVSSK